MQYYMYADGNELKVKLNSLRWINLKIMFHKMMMFNSGKK